VIDSEYQLVLLRAYDNPGGECSREPLRLELVHGPGLKPGLHVSCARPDRKEYSAGDLFLQRCRLVPKKTRAEYLYRPPGWGLRPVSAADAERFKNGEPVSVDGV
jgi:hypothetical protein